MSGGQDVIGEPGKPSLEGTRLQLRGRENSDSVIPGLLAGRSQAGPFSPQNLAELDPPLVCAQSRGCSFHMIGPGALWVPTGNDLAGGRPLRVGGGEKGTFSSPPHTLRSRGHFRGVST